MNAQTLSVWVGTGGQSGIHQVQIDTQAGRLINSRKAADIPGAGFLALHPKLDVLYATGSVDKKPSVVAFQINGPSLAPLANQPIGDGGAACIAVNHSGTALASAQYGGGSTATFPLDSNGKILPRVSLIEHGPGSKVNKQRQDKPHPHWVGYSFDDRFLFVPDLGRDRVEVYQTDSNATISASSSAVVSPGSGPRHMKLHPSNDHAYLLNELTLTLSVMKFDAQAGKLNEVQVIPTLPSEEKDRYLNTAGEVRIHPNGNFVYASNRGHDSIAVFSIQKDATLKFIQRESVRGSWPRNFALSPDGKWLIVGGRRSNTIALFQVDPGTGKIAFTRSIINLPDPICFVFAR